MPLEDEETIAYTYVGNVDPTNSSVAFTYEGKKVSIGEMIELTEEEYAKLGLLFVFDDGTEVDEEEPAFAVGGVISGGGRAPVLGHSPVTPNPATSDSGDTLGESQNASGSS